MVLSSRSRNESRPTLQAQALTLQELELQLLQLPETNKELRDKLLLLIGFAGGFRRSELAALTTDDIVLKEYGFDLIVRKSKTD